MGDLICRKAAINTFDCAKVDEGYCTEYEIGYNDGIDFAISKLSTLPSAQPEWKWIPCSEKLPNQNGQFLVQYKNGEMDVVHCSNVNPFWTNLKTDWHWVGTAQFVEVVAWMPLPKAYEVEKE